MKASVAELQSCSGHPGAGEEKGRFGVRFRSGQQEDTPLKKHRLVLFSVSNR